MLSPAMPGRPPFPHIVMRTTLRTMLFLVAMQWQVFVSEAHPVGDCLTEDDHTLTHALVTEMSSPAIANLDHDHADDDIDNDESVMLQTKNHTQANLASTRELPDHETHRGQGTWQHPGLQLANAYMTWLSTAFDDTPVKPNENHMPLICMISILLGIVLGWVVFVICYWSCVSTQDIDVKKPATAESKSLPHKEERGVTAALANEPQKAEASIAPERNRVFSFILVADVACALGGCLLASFFPGELSARGLPQSHTGVIFSSFYVANFFCSPVAATVLQHVTDMRKVYVLGSIVNGAANMLFAWVYLIDGEIAFIVTCCGLRMVAGCSNCFLYTASYSMICVLFPDSLSTKQGLLGMLQGTVLILGPFMGSFLYTAGGLRLPFMVLGSFEFCCGCALSLLMPRVRNADAESEDNEVPWASSLRWSIIAPCLASFLGRVCLSVIEPSLELHLTGSPLHFQVMQVGMCFGIPAMLYAVLSPFAGHIDDNYLPDDGGASMMTVGTVILVSFFALLAPVPFLGELQAWKVYIAMAFMGTGIALLNVPLMKAFQTALQDLEDMKRATLSASLYTMTSVGGTIVGPIQAGFIIRHFSTRWLYTFCSIMLLPLLILVPLNRYVNGASKSKDAGHTDANKS